MIANEDQYNEITAEKARVQQIFERAIEELEALGIAHFAGFIKEDSNLHGTQQDGEIKYNEKFVYLTDEEVQRWAWHEIQHAFTQKEAQTAEDPRLLYAFALHPSLQDLYARMQEVYQTHLSEGFPFRRELKQIPERYIDLAEPHTDYFHPIEILSLLRGYQCYLNQVREKNNLTSDPSEFIKAFKPEDLVLLNPQFRIKLAKELLKDNPHILDMTRVELVWD